MSQTPLSDEIAQISREEFDRYLTDFRPLEQKTVASLDDSSVGKAMDASQSDTVQARASLARMRERYGVGTTPMQAAGEARQNALSGALGTLSAGNTAAQGDKDNQRQTMAGLLNVGQGIRQQSLGGFTSASGLESQRSATDANNKAAYKQQQSADKASTYSAVASLGMMAAMMM